ncbi:MAG: hypothetical protein JNL83_03800 [Myxococcales bacterium]|nr:hypothetical protein [Myxococcales bacterium]
MRIRSSILVVGKLLAVTSIAAATACGGGGGGKIMADTPVLPYQAPDIDEITGMESEDEDAEETAPAPAPAGSAQNPQK